jgi:hypothetical protein
MGYLDKALETMQKQGDGTINTNLIESTLMEIGKEYKPGLIRWIRECPDLWRQLIALESRINETALSKDDETILKDALSDYREFFEEMTKNVC